MIQFTFAKIRADRVMIKRVMGLGFRFILDVIVVVTVVVVGTSAGLVGIIMIKIDEMGRRGRERGNERTHFSMISVGKRMRLGARATLKISATLFKITKIIIIITPPITPTITTTGRRRRRGRGRRRRSRNIGTAKNKGKG